MGPWNPSARGVRHLRAAFLVRTFDVGGTERQLVNLSRGLVARGHDVLVVTVVGGGGMVPELREAGAAVHELAAGHRTSSQVLHLPKAVTVLRRWKPDVVHGYLAFGNTLAAAVKPFVGTPVVQGIRVVAPERDAGAPAVQLLYRSESLSSRWADAVISNSNAGRVHARARGFPADRVHVVPNGIDTDTLRPDPAARAKLRAEWDADEHDVVVGRIGRMRPNKDFSTFLRAAALAVRRCERLRFVCVGDGPQRLELEGLARELALTPPRLIWVGERPETVAVMNALDLMVSSSRVESFPNVVAEAMACGVPCIVTDAGDSAEIVGDHGVVVPPAAPDAMAEGVLAMAGGNRPSAAALRRDIEERFSISRMVDATERILAEVVEEAR